MSEELKQDTQSADDAGTGTAQDKTEERQGAKLFTQSEIDEIVKKEKAKAERATERRLRQEQKAEPQDKKEAKSEAKAEKSDDDDLRSEMTKLKTDLQFERAVKKLAFIPNEDQEELLRSMFESGGADKMNKLAAQLKPADKSESQQEEKVAPSYKSPGAPSGAPAEVLENDATKWSKDYVARLKRDGSLFKELEKFGANMGGENGIFQKRMPR